MATDYDKAKLTDRERLAAKNQTKISTQNAKDVKNQLNRQLSNYDFSDAQNRALADTQLKQNSRKTSEDRFEAQRDLQSSALGLMGSMGSAMNGSTTGNFMNMLRSRNDKDNNTYWSQLQQNQDAVENAYQDSVNQNNVARRDAMQSAEKALSDIRSDWSANMNNINPKLFETGNIGGNKKLDPSTAWNASKAKANKPTISGYVINDNKGKGHTPTGARTSSVSMNTGTTRNQARGGRRNKVSGDYFSRLVNTSNGRPSAAKKKNPTNAKRAAAARAKADAKRNEARKRTLDSVTRNNINTMRKMMLDNVTRNNINKMRLIGNR